jgi:O-antigen/teichoic acid export membrane protein
MVADNVRPIDTLLESQGQSATAATVERQTRRGLSWNLAGAFATNALRIVVLAVLGRTLDSSEFGVVAAAVTVNVVLYSIRDVGFGPALVQRKTLEAGHITTTFAVSMYLGVGLWGLLVFTAPLIGDLWSISESVDVIRAMAFLFLLRGVATTSRIVCQREMNFRIIALADAVSFAAGSVLSMVLAVLGAGPWALVAGYLFEEAIAMLMFLVASPPPVSFRIEGARFRELMQFGAGQTVSQIVGILATYGDNFVVGSRLGATALGYYTRAYDLIKFPSAVFASIVGSVLFPAFSRLQDHREQLATGFRRVLFLNALVLLPASTALIVLAPEAILLLIGPGWDEAVLPFRILSISILFRTSQKLGAMVAQAKGRANAVAIAYVVYMTCVIGGASVGIRWGVVGVSISTAASIIIVCCISCLLAMRESGVSLRTVLAAHMPGMILSVVVIVISLPLTLALRRADVPSPSTFAIVSLSTVAICLLWLYLLVRRAAADSDLRWLADELARIRTRLTRRRGAVS